MAIKGGMPKTPAATSSREERDAFISGAPGKTTYPWQDARVRSDVMIQVNVKQPEDLVLQIEWLVQQQKGLTRRQLIEDILREGVKARLKAHGIET
jgi:hypothetical protein